jgi:hypothetical protein
MTTAQRRVRIGIYTLQIESFPAILHQKSTAGVSLAVDFVICLAEKSLALECYAVLGGRFLLTRLPEDEGILAVFQGRWRSCGEKDSPKTV